MNAMRTVSRLLHGETQFVPSRASNHLSASVEGTCLALSGVLSSAGEWPGLLRPAAAAMEGALTTGKVTQCVTSDGMTVSCQIQRNGMKVHLYYGDANGSGVGSDVPAITRYQRDLASDAITMSIAYFARQDETVDCIPTFPKVRLLSVVPNTTVDLFPGHVCFTAITLRPQGSLCCRPNRTQYLLNLCRLARREADIMRLINVIRVLHDDIAHAAPWRSSRAQYSPNRSGVWL